MDLQSRKPLTNTDFRHLTSDILHLTFPMFLYIARHAWAGERGDPRWPDDSLRELTPEGITRYMQVVKALAACGLAPQRIATAPTLSLVIPTCAYRSKRTGGKTTVC